MVTAPAVKFAVTGCGPVIVTVVEGLFGLATAPVQFVKLYPALAVAEIGTIAPAAKNPDTGSTVPPVAGDAAVVNRYCVSNAAVYEVVPAEAVTLCEIAPASDQLLNTYRTPVAPACGDVVESECEVPSVHVNVWALV